jgi:hypothetical protein
MQELDRPVFFISVSKIAGERPAGRKMGAGQNARGLSGTMTRQEIIDA